jgi:hypothetical protein
VGFLLTLIGLTLSGTHVFADSPVAILSLDFDEENSNTVGRVRVCPGPRPPEFPDLAATNQAVRFDGRGSRVVIAPDTIDDKLQFTGGDEITISAWIAPIRSRNSSPRYVIGKGRTGNKGFQRDNQNWALRVTPKGDRYQLSFLFATPKNPAGQNSGGVDWHRWTSDDSVQADDGWHFVAVSYRFGDPKSIQGWIDGAACQGRWDMAGPTTADPVVDDDEVWIGSALNGSSGNSFLGSVDAVRVYRTRLTDQQVRRRYNRDDSIERTVKIEKPTMPKFAAVPEGQVLFQAIEGLPLDDRWPDKLDLAELPESTYPGSTWRGQAFFFSRLPLRFDDWGIRSDWSAPLLLRVAADVELPTGTRNFLLRARSLGRLWIDGKLVAETNLKKRGAPSGEEPITPLAEPPLPGLRVKGYRQQEVIAAHTIEGDQATKTCRVVLELMSGGKGQRTETGEVCVAVANADASSYNVLLPADSDWGSVSLEKSAAAAFLAAAEQQLHDYETDLRRSLAASRDRFWEQRHAIAQQWAADHPAPVPQSIDDGTNPIDGFLGQRIAAELRRQRNENPSQHQSAFASEVLPILQQHCLRCHGKANKGGLRLDSRAAAIAGGDSGWAAVVPGKAIDSELVLRIESADPDTRMPPDGEGLGKAQQQVLIDWIDAGAKWPQPVADPEKLRPTVRLDDASFLRRVSLDTIGVPPTEAETRAFLKDSSADKRQRLIERLLADERFADHWVSDWLDMLAENPTLLNTSLNSTGPFRFFLHDALVDHKPIDRMITELIMMRGNKYTGGSAGFGVAGENDSPMAAKAHVLASGLLAVELQCARCHDSPFHSTTQEDLFSLAAMLSRKQMSVPKTSRVPVAFFEERQREPLIEVTLPLGSQVRPEWPLARFTNTTNDESIAPLVENPNDSRERLAALITSPENTRFPAVIVNRVWARLMGKGIVDSLSDWEHHQPSHPELLRWLSHQFVASGYDVRQVVRLILTSEVYARESRDISPDDPAAAFFAAPLTRRLTAEQIVDSLFAATGRSMNSEELTFVHDGRRPLSNRLTLGVPNRAWMMATLNNERDRPSLSLPRARAIVDVLKAFGWNGSRQKPIHERETDPNVLQPGILANGTLTMSLSRAALASELADLAVNTESPEDLADSLFLRFLTRFPTNEERELIGNQLRQDFADRIVSAEQQSEPMLQPELPLVHWFNHLRPRANEIQQEIERRVRQGPPHDPRLRSDWRSRYEDVLWSLINHDEFVWMP